MKNKLEENTMVTTKNWIEKIREFVRNAMNEGLSIYKYKNEDCYDIRIVRNNPLHETFDITIRKDRISINTPNSGFIVIEIELSKRDKLELDAVMLSIEEYKEDIAITEFNNFFKKDNNSPTTIDNLDDDD